MWGLVAVGVAVAGDAVTFSAKTVVIEGESPSLRVDVAAPGDLDVALGCGGRDYRFRGAVEAGRSVSLVLSGLSVGSHDCAGQVHFVDPTGARGQIPLAFEVQIRPPLTWRWAAEDLDLEAGTLVVHPSRPLREARVALAGLRPEILASANADLTDPDHPRFTWSPVPDVVTLEVVGTDASGTAGRLVLSPWSYAIPHDDVVFETGAAAIPETEVAKLTTSWDEIVEVRRTYGAIVDVQLFVVGFTDTVGDRGANRALSEARARSIARWFRGRGFDGPIWVQGMGESAPAVVTGDEVDEPRNRRALYLLAAHSPVIAGVPADGWRGL